MFPPAATDPIFAERRNVSTVSAVFPMIAPGSACRQASLNGMYVCVLKLMLKQTFQNKIS